MGSYAQCWLDNFFIGSSKNIDTELISLFRPQDKIVRSSPIHNLPSHLEHYRESLDEDQELKVVYYEAPIDVIRDRLDILGYNLATAKEAFRAWISEERNQAMEMVDEWQEKDSESRDLMASHYRKECEILSALSPETWIEGLKEIRASSVLSLTLLYI